MCIDTISAMDGIPQQKTNHNSQKIVDAQQNELRDDSEQSAKQSKASPELEQQNTRAKLEALNHKPNTNSTQQENKKTEKSGLSKSIYAGGFIAMAVGSIGVIINTFQNGLKNINPFLGLLTVFGIVTTEASDFENSQTKRLFSFFSSK